MSIQNHLSTAITGGFNAVFSMTVDGQTACKYCKYVFNLTGADCADTVGFSTELYLYAPGGKRKKTVAPVDVQASCFCGKFYRSGQTEIGCTVCNRWCHTGCAFSAPMTPTQCEAVCRRIEATWKCPTCAAL